MVALNIDNNKVELISTETIKKNENEDNGNFILYGAIGYLYYEQELNEICKIYGYGYGADENTITKYTIGGPYEGEENNKLSLFEINDNLLNLNSDFSDVLQNGGFDVIISNPPIKLHF